VRETSIRLAHAEPTHERLLHDEPESGPTAALSCERSDRARRKLDCLGPSLGLLQPDILLCPMDDTSVEDSEQASAASTVPLLATLLSFLRGLRPDLPRHRRRKVRDCKSNWQLPQFSTIDFGKHLWQPQALSFQCTRAHMKALGRSRWLNGLCRCLHSGYTNGTGPRPSIEP
jgi:hypothetical protein